MNTIRNLNVLIFKRPGINYVSLYRLCGLVVRVPSCKHEGPGFDSLRYSIYRVAVGLERGPLSPCEDK
jgi:hypothetical protein